jgi:hypothetical protein
MIRALTTSALIGMALVVFGCDSDAPTPAAAVEPAAVTITEPSNSEAPVGATGEPIDAAAKTVIVVSAPGIVSTSAVRRVADLETQQRDTQARIEQFVDRYQEKLDDPAAREQLVQSSAADLELYKRQSLELYNAQRALAQQQSR